VRSKEIKVGGIYAYKRYRSYSGLSWTHAVKVITVGKKKVEIKFVNKETFEEIDVSNPRYYGAKSEWVPLAFIKGEYQQYVEQIKQQEAEREVLFAGYAKERAEREKFQKEVYEPAFEELYALLEKIDERINPYSALNELPYEAVLKLTEILKQNTGVLVNN
jgi:hypothetical protein